MRIDTFDFKVGRCRRRGMPMAVATLWALWALGATAQTVQPSPTRGVPDDATGSPHRRTPAASERPATPAVTNPTATAEGRIEVDADSLDYDRVTGWVHAEDNVVVRKGLQVLKADKVRVNAVTEQAIAEGNVWFRRHPGQKPWRGTRLEYNFGTGEASVADLAGVTDPFIVKSEESHRRPDGTFDVERAYLTTCTNMPHRHYHVRASRVSIVPDDYLVCRGASVWLGPVPVFWFPYWRRDLNDDFGWHFYPGYNSRMGAFLLSSYRFPITEQVYGETHLDYRTERGVAGGQDIVWRDNGGRWEGELSGYYAQDDKPLEDDEDPATKDVDEQRYRVRFEHGHQFGARDYVLANIDYLSDTDMLEDFFEDDYREKSQPDNHLVYTYRGEQFTVNLEARKRLNDFYDDLDRLPELSLDVSRQQLMESIFYYEGENSVGYLEKLFAEGSGSEDYSAFRLDSRHVASVPQRYFGFLNLIPRAGVRGTYYSDTFETVTTEQLATTTTTNQSVTGGTTNTVVATTSATNTVDTMVSTGADFRSMFELGMEVSFKAYKTWQGGVVSPLRHIIEPYANYTFLPEPSLLPENIYPFDNIDALDEQHRVKLGMRNKFQTKHKGAPFDLVDVDLYTFYRLIEDGAGNDGIGDVYMDAELRPTTAFTIEADAHFDVDASELRTFNTEFTIAPEHIWRASLDYRYTVDTSSRLLADMTLFPTSAWDYNLYGRYEFEEARLEEVGGYLQRNLDCMAIRLGTNFIPAYTRSDGIEEEAEWSAIVSIWLTAFPDMGLRGRHKH